MYGPGPLKGQPYVVDSEFRGWLYRAYEVRPKGHRFAGRRRFQRAGMSVRKGRAKTERLACVAFAELHPDGPVRCDGFDARGEPVGVPVRDPYIPLMSVTVDQVEELAYGALLYMCQEGPDADLFDAGLERVIRLDQWGRADGKAVALANSPGARDGGRTTFQGFDEPHRLWLPRQLEAHETMDQNLGKRAMDDPWAMYVGTAGQLGQRSVAEKVHHEAELIAAGKIRDPKLFYAHRWADGTYDLKDRSQRLAAIEEATGPAGEWGPGQFETIADKYERPGADRAYWERVWLNRWLKSGAQAWDMNRWADLKHESGDPTAPERARIAPGSLVVAGFDGARFRDSTGIVITDVVTGTQEPWALWERPVEADDPDAAPWDVPEPEVEASITDLMRVMEVWRLYADPPYWVAEVGRWAGKWPDRVEEWWTNAPKRMGLATRAYREAMDSGAVGWAADHPLADRFTEHTAAAGRADTNLRDDDGQALFVLQKIHPDRKFDLSMAAVISWVARVDALKAGAKKREPVVPRRIRRGWG